MNNYYSKNYYAMNNKIVIKCGRCLNNLRVPLDKGKISVTCPVCSRQFVYNPDSILATLKQVILSLRSWVRKSRRNLVIFLVSVLALAAALFFIIYGSFAPKKTYDSPGLKAYETRQEQKYISEFYPGL